MANRAGEKHARAHPHAARLCAFTHAAQPSWVHGRPGLPCLTAVGSSLDLQTAAFAGLRSVDEINCLVPGFLAAAVLSRF